MTDPVNTPAEPPVETTPNSLLGTPPAEPNPTEPPADATPPAGAPESVDGYEVNVEGFNYDEFKTIPENQEFLAKLSLAKPATSAGVQLFNEPCGLIKL